ncbi:MerR family transcriptional regulator [Acaryochloris marina]|uniref:Transcriptional regulator, MerR family n=1 Tax=Acaryochloris marina (strain MBIC 11017) TaxID=329726 RepID=B0C952_ACAM1|nr:transcriptional regulator, MerR family [Acaryochloris marina MBIC11017]
MPERNISQRVSMKVGELAQQTGVSVRTLHHYDKIGLLSPSRRTEAGYRLYGDDDIIRLQQIVSLRQLGFSLAQIQDCLNQNEFSPHDVVQLHLSKLKEHIELQQLYARLEIIASQLQSTEAISIQDFLQLIEVTNMIEKYYTPEQQAQLQARREALGEEHIHQAEAEWQTLIDQARTEMAKGTNPASEAMQVIVQKWQSLIQQFTGGDSGIASSLQSMYQQEGAEVASRGMVDPELMEFMGKAMAATKGSDHTGQV